MLFPISCKGSESHFRTQIWKADVNNTKVSSGWLGVPDAQGDNQHSVCHCNWFPCPMWSPMPAVSWTGGYSPCWAVPPLRQWLQASSSGFEIPNEASSFTQHLMPLCTSRFGYFLGSTPLPGNRIGRSLRMESCGSWVISHVESVVQGVDVINLCQLLSLRISGPCSHSGVQLLL